MEPFTVLTAVAAPYYHADVDTDELIPHRFLRKPLSAGYGNFLFHDKRRGPDERENPEFVLNVEAYRRAQILVSGPNFGCGSTREGAVYALRDYGFRAIVASGFADIFRGNCVQNGLLPIVRGEGVVAGICDELTARPGAEVEIDLPGQTLTAPSGRTHRFEIDAAAKARLLEGVDDIAVTRRHGEAFERFERAYRRRMPWLSRS